MLTSWNARCLFECKWNAYVGKLKWFILRQLPFQAGRVFFDIFRVLLVFPFFLALSGNAIRD